MDRAMSSSATIQTPVAFSYLSTPNLSKMSPWLRVPRTKRLCNRVTMRDRSENRRQLQRGRYLSIEAIQTVQALKLAKKDYVHLDRAFDSRFRRLLKLDMMAVLRELLRQNECALALKVFEDVRKEHWYKPRVSLYADFIEVLASNGLFEQVELIHSYMRAEGCLDSEIEGFNSLFKTLINFKLTELAMQSYYLMKEVGCEPDKTSFRLLINGLESIGETGHSAILRQDAQKIYGESLGFLQEMEEVTTKNY